MQLLVAPHAADGVEVRHVASVDKKLHSRWAVRVADRAADANPPELHHLHEGKEKQQLRIGVAFDNDCCVAAGVAVGPAGVWVNHCRDDRGVLFAVPALALVQIDEMFVPITEVVKYIQKEKLVFDLLLGDPENKKKE